MSGSPQVDPNEWKLETVITGEEITHHNAGSSTGSWKRDQFLGKGGYGEVWREMLTSNPSKKPRFRAVKQIRKTDKAVHELSNLIKLSTRKYYGSAHLKHFVEFFGWYEDQHSRIYVSMEYIPNNDLQYHIVERHKNGSGFQESEGAFIVAKISEALQFMHDSQVMHRDLKPANILVSHLGPNWQIKLADFGISKSIEASGAQTKAGTDGYMAPEVADTNRKASYTKAVDIWSLGAVAFCILTGRPPFQDNLAVGRYIDGNGKFPFDLLLPFSGKLVIFIMQLMDVAFNRRPKVGQVLQHEWLRMGGDQAPKHGPWSAPATAEWEDSATEDPDDLEQESSRPNINQNPADTSNSPPGPIESPQNHPQKLHHAVSNPIGNTGMAGYGGGLPPRPSSFPAEDIKHKSGPVLIENPELYTNGDNIRSRHDLADMDHGAITSPDQRLTQMSSLSPTKASTQLTLPSSHADSGYITTSSSSIFPHLMSEGISIEPTRSEGSQPYPSHLPSKDPTDDRNHAPINHFTPLQPIQAKVNTEAFRPKDAPGIRPPQIDNLIDSSDPKPGLVNSTPQLLVFGPWLPDENPWAESHSLQNILD
ncbi:kinase-like domain-containing protein [Nemania sp. NC0429]|nr:kinase-like domain-containing protein [Nemania sp. NC0429]